jgi:threonine dehydrogenase-like Zn-dependent dehydrogenase
LNAFVIGGDGPDRVWNGAFAEYVLTTEGTLYPKPSAISWDAAAVTEPLAGAWKGVIAHSEMRVADDVVVIGVGSIGLLCLMVARIAGAARLIAVDTSNHALEQALRLGATHAVNPATTDARKRIYEIMRHLSLMED